MSTLHRIKDDINWRNNVGVPLIDRYYSNEEVDEIAK